VCEVDVRGLVRDHLRACQWTNGAPSRFVDCEGSRKTSKESTSRREADRKLALHRRIVDDKGAILVALDAYVARTFDDPCIPEWRRLALFQYREKWGVHVAHPYRYETRVAADNRRAETLGEVYCRFCGGCLFHQVKQPHRLVAAVARGAAASDGVRAARAVRDARERPA
jgi:hypothetical protein